jgi:hypothetical protein
MADGDLDFTLRMAFDRGAGFSPVIISISPANPDATETDVRALMAQFINCGAIFDYDPPVQTAIGAEVVSRGVRKLFKN